MYEATPSVFSPLQDRPHARTPSRPHARTPARPHARTPCHGLVSSLENVTAIAVFFVSACTAAGKNRAMPPKNRRHIVHVLSRATV